MARRVGLITVGFALALAAGWDGNATDLTWIGTSSDWNNTNNWSPHQIPTGSDHLIITNGTITVPATANFGMLDYSGGFLEGSLTVASNAVLNIQGTGDLYPPAVTNAGTVVWTGLATLWTYNHPFYNLPGAVLEIHNDGSWNGSSAINNAGVLRKVAGNGTSTINLALTNSGTVEALSGTIAFATGGQLRGQFMAATGAAVHFTGGSFDLISGPPAHSGAGDVNFTGNSTITFSAPITSFDLSAGSLSGNTVVAGTLNWSGGTFASLTVPTGGVVNIIGTGDLYPSTITNSGTVVWSGTSTLWNYNSSFYNLPGGVVEIHSDGTIHGSGSFNNGGLVRKLAGNGTTEFGVPFNNSGSVEAQSGTISLTSGANLGGVFTAAKGAAINFANGTFGLLSGPPASDGTGQVGFVGNAVITFLASITNFDLTGGNLTGSNVVGGTLNWIGGNISGPLTVATGAVLNIRGTGEIYPGVITNAGTVVWSGSGALWNYGHDFYNLPGALMELRNDQGYNGQGVFHNAGLVRKTAGNGVSSLNLPFDNSGAVEAQSGIISFQGGYSNSPAANLTVALSDPSTGAGAGQITFGQPVILSGGFSVKTLNGFRSPPGSGFQVLRYPSSTNLFDAMNGLDLGAGLLLRPQFTLDGTALTATVYSQGPMPQLFISRSPTGILVMWPLDYQDWTLCLSTNCESVEFTHLPLPSLA